MAIVDDMAGFFRVPGEWARAEMPEPANDIGNSGESDSDGEARHDR